MEKTTCSTGHSIVFTVSEEDGLNGIFSRHCCIYGESSSEGRPSWPGEIGKGNLVFFIENKLERKRQLGQTGISIAEGFIYVKDEKYAQGF